MHSLNGECIAFKGNEQGMLINITLINIKLNNNELSIVLRIFLIVTLTYNTGVEPDILL